MIEFCVFFFVFVFIGQKKITTIVLITDVKSVRSTSRTFLSCTLFSRHSSLRQHRRSHARLVRASRSPTAFARSNNRGARAPVTTSNDNFVRATLSCVCEIKIRLFRFTREPTVVDEVKDSPHSRGSAESNVLAAAKLYRPPYASELTSRRPQRHCDGRSANQARAAMPPRAPRPVPGRRSGFTRASTCSLSSRRLDDRCTPSESCAPRAYADPVLSCLSMSYVATIGLPRKINLESSLVGRTGSAALR